VNVARLTALMAAAALTLAACGGSDAPVVSDADVTSEEVAGDPLPPIEAEPAPVSMECPTGDSDAVVQSFPEAPPFCLESGASYAAAVSTSLGDFTIDLDPVAAPTAVNSFVFLARNNYFDNTLCHRVIQQFVVQCGDPTATGTGGPGYSFVDELPAPGQYEIGSIAMANSGPNTNGSQFFIISGPSGAGLDPLYSLFGQIRADDLGVVSAMDAVGSVDSSGISSEDVVIIDVSIIQS